METEDLVVPLGDFPLSVAPNLNPDVLLLSLGAADADGDFSFGGAPN